MALSNLTVWRFDPREFRPGELMQPNLAKRPSLKDSELLAERALCEIDPTSAQDRARALYCYELHRHAYAGAIGYDAFLYELEIDQDDIIHRGDLGFYEDIKSSGDGVASQMAAKNYWSGNDHPSNSIIEILVPRALVIRNHGRQRHTRLQHNDAADYGL